MGQPLAFLDGTALGDRFISVAPKAERIGAGVVPVYESDLATLPDDSQNWRYLWEAIFSQSESGSGPTGQWNLHQHFDAILAAISDGTLSHVFAWIGDEDVKTTVAVGGGGGPGVNIDLTLTDLDPLGAPGIVGDYLYFSGGGWGKVLIEGTSPPETVRIDNLDVAVADGETVYRAWRIYPAVRVLAWDPGAAEEQSMDAFRMGERLSMDSRTLPVSSPHA